ncbi:hypothetical protein BCR44DRAFT_39289, partial [Catenaria anguillulae PL171]
MVTQRSTPSVTVCVFRAMQRNLSFDQLVPVFDVEDSSSDSGTVASGKGSSDTESPDSDFESSSSSASSLHHSSAYHSDSDSDSNSSSNSESDSSSNSDSDTSSNSGSDSSSNSDSDTSSNSDSDTSSNSDSDTSSNPDSDTSSTSDFDSSNFGIDSDSNCLSNPSLDSGTDVSSLLSSSHDMDSDSDSSTDSDSDSDSDSSSNSGTNVHATPSHYRILPQNPKGNNSMYDHIMNGFRPSTRSSWISVTLSLTWGVYYTTKAEFVSTHITGYHARDLYALQVPQNRLLEFDSLSCGASVKNRTMAGNFTATARERLARRELVVYRFERVVIPEVVADCAREWFQGQVAAAGGLFGRAKFPFREWQQYMDAELPEWLGMIRNPITAWELEDTQEEFA